MLHALGPVGGRYRLERELGRGTFGTVYAARAIAGGDLVALKLLSRFDEGASAERFRRETEILRRMPPHPNVVAVLDAGEHGSLPFVVMELLTGGSLAASIEKGAEPSLADSVKIVARLASALEHVHARGVVHRDVTAKNVLLDARGEPKLVDFGLSLEVDRATRLTETGELVGTFHAFAPEQLAGGRAALGPEVDVYALAALLYRLVTGRSAFAGARTIREVEALLRGGVTPAELVNPRVPPALARAIERGLATDPKDRPRAGDFGRLLAPFGGPLPGPPPLRGGGRGPDLPDEIAGHRIVSVLGKGGMGVVYEGVSQQGARVAVKVLHAAPSEEALGRFDRERRLLSTIGTVPGVVPILDAGATSSGPYIVMPLLAGGTLAERLKRGPLGVEETRSLGRRLATALGRLHRSGIVHRDVKPSNVLFDAAGAGFLSDLGLGKHFRDDVPGAELSVALSSAEGVRGTLGYMPPEQLANASTVGPPADVFSLGALLYECLAGVPAFEADTLVALMQRVLAGPPTPLSAIREETPLALERVIARALSREPNARFADGDALARALDETGASRVLRLAFAGTALAGAAALAAFALTPGAPQPVAPQTTATVPSASATNVSTASVSPPPRPTGPKTLVLGPARSVGALTTGVTIDRVSVSPDGAFAVFAQRHELHVLDLATEVVTSLLNGHHREVLGVAALSSRRVASIADDEEDILLWDLARGTHTSAGKHFNVKGLAATPDGTVFATCGSDLAVRVWDGRRELELATPSTFRALSFTCGARQLFGIHHDQLILLDAKTGAVAKELRYPSLGHAAIAPGVPLVVCFAPEGRLGFADLRGARPSFRTIASGAPKVLAVAFAPDARHFAASGSDGKVRVWNAECELVATIDLVPVMGKMDRALRSIAFLPDGSGLVGGTQWGRLVKIGLREE